MSDGMKELFVIVPYTSKGEEKKRWTKIGVAFVNKDGSFNLKFDAYPANGGDVHMRDAESKEDREARQKSAPF